MQELNLTGRDLYSLMVSFFKDKKTCKMKIQCLGNSMAPFIIDKNILIIEAADKSKAMHKGDIVVAALHDKKQILIHRIIQINGQRCLIKGDNNNRADGWFCKKDLLGIVRRVETQSGIGYTPKSWQNFFIAMGSRFNILKQALLPGLGFLKEPQEKIMKNTG